MKGDRSISKCRRKYNRNRPKVNTSIKSKTLPSCNRCHLFLNYEMQFLQESSLWKQDAGELIRGTSRTIYASNIESRESNLFPTTTDFLRIVRSSRGWLATGPKFKLHPHTESLTRVGARLRHHAGANFNRVLRCLVDGKLRCICFRANFRSCIAFPIARKNPRRNFNCVSILWRTFIHSKKWYCNYSKNFLDAKN